MLILRKNIFASLFIVSLAASCALAGHKDYSTRGGEYTILKDIRLGVSKVVFTGKRESEFEGRKYEASVFRVKTRVNIQTWESPVGGIFEDLEAEYDLIVGEDKDNFIHHTLLEDTHRTWAKYDRKSVVLPEQTLCYENGGYFMRDRKSSPNIAWFDGRFVKLEFVRFPEKKKSGFGAISEFWEKKMRFRAGEADIPFACWKNDFPEEFLRLYDAGAFLRK